MTLTNQGRLPAGGIASHSWSLPNTLSLVNQSAFCQGLAIDINPSLAFRGVTGLGRLVLGN